MTITARRVATDRLTVNVLERDGSEHGEPVVLVHGNVSSSVFWRALMEAMPAGLRPIAVDLRGFGDTDPAPVDASRGVADYSDDVVATLDALGLDAVHLVGWSLGGGVVLDVLRSHPERVRSVTLENPVSPYGFGGTRGADGELVAGGAGSGGAGANPAFVQRIADRDTSADDPLSPRAVMRAFYFAPGFDAGADEDAFVDSMLSTRTGTDNYPGDASTADAWPGAGPGTSGVLNTIAPTNFRVTPDDLAGLAHKPPIAWVRGAVDQIVSDASMFDLANLGRLGAVPGWPGDDDCPPQPMVTQTRAVLDAYAAAGGSYRETVLDGVGHSPHVEAPEAFLAALTAVVDEARAVA